MIIITILETSGEKTDVAVSDRKSLFNLTTIMENSSVVKQYKVSQSEGNLVYDLQLEYGIGDSPKFTSQFNYG